MGANVVVLFQPAFGDGAHLLQDIKEIGVQDLFAIGPIEAFNVRIFPKDTGTVCEGFPG
jgi:hypothetical protein